MHSALFRSLFLKPLIGLRFWAVNKFRRTFIDLNKTTSNINKHASVHLSRRCWSTWSSCVFATPSRVWSSAEMRPAQRSDRFRLLRNEVRLAFPANPESSALKRTETGCRIHRSLGVWRVRAASWSGPVLVRIRITVRTCSYFSALVPPHRVTSPL